MESATEGNQQLSMINFNPQSSPPQAASAAADNPQYSIINRPVCSGSYGSR